MKKVESLSEFHDRGDLRSPEDCINDALSNLKDHESLKNVKKCMVIMLDDSNEEYSVAWFQSGMKMSQCVSLCEVAKSQFLSEMGY